MAESNSEPLRCPCGFYGRDETNGLCSKCYNEHLQRKTAEANGTARNENTTVNVSSEQLSHALGSVVTKPPTKSPSLPGQNQSSSPNGKTSANEATSSTTTMPHTNDVASPLPPEKVSDSPQKSNKSTSSEASGNATKRVRENSECETTTDDDKPIQKNKKRCFTCNCKLQPAIREIGRCKCELVFCQLHRLPEQHDCIYDHKANGRKEARDKMVSPKKHMGTSLKRIDSDS